MKELLAVVLVAATVTLQGCFVVIGNKGGSSTKQSSPSKTHSPRTAIQATLDNINSMSFENHKVEALNALVETPMSECDYIAMMKVIKKLSFENHRQELTIKAINARSKYKAAENQEVFDCNN